MSLAETYRCARALEAIENYARADIPSSGELDDQGPSTAGGHWVDQDEGFWLRVLSEPEESWGQELELHSFALSEWIARVPGLYWSKGSKALRDLAADAIEYTSDQWTTYTPLGKSQIVLGGVGTLKLPPDVDDRRLVTLSAGHNASSGIPALISAEVWEHHGLAEGHVLHISAQWKRMQLGWSERFPSIRGIPRGCLVISDPRQIISTEAQGTPTQFHPCTVMEYSSGDLRLFDFVYATADTRVEGYRRKLERFFRAYKDKQERYGQYLLSGDVANPLWDAEFDSPSALNRADPSAEAHLAILSSRIRSVSFRGTAIEQILEVLVSHYDTESLKRLSDYVSVPTSHWYTGEDAANSATQLLQVCVDRNKAEELLDAVALEYPKALKERG